MKEKRIAFIHGHKHPVTDKVQNLLIESYYDYKIDIYDVTEIIKKDIFIIIVNFFFIIKEHGMKILKRDYKFKRSFFTTTYIFNKIKEKFQKVLSEGNYTFSFQINSRFDTSSPGIPHFVYTDHTHLENLSYPLFNKKALLPLKWIELEKTIYENATLIFTYGSNVQDSIVNEYSINDSKVICAGVGSNIDKTAELEVFRKDYSNKHILFVGLNWLRKGGDDLVAAFKNILKRHPDAKLTIIGAAPEINIENCNIVGKIDVNETANYYSEASIFCLPTKLEPFGIVFLEAMSFKLPVIGTRIGSIPDFIEDGKNGFMIEPGNIEQLEEKLNELLDSPEKCKNFGEYGYNIVKEKYSWEKIAVTFKENIEKFIN